MGLLSALLTWSVAMVSPWSAPAIRTPVTFASRITTSSTLESKRISTPRDCRDSEL